MCHVYYCMKPLAALVLMPLKKCGVKIIGVLGVGYMLFSILLIIAGM